MEKIIHPNQLDIIQKLKQRGKKIVLAGGCFDILHDGHAEFLKKAKQEGDILAVILESDANIRKLKGEGRPVNNQKYRAEKLSSLQDVDYILLIPQFSSDKEYDELVKTIEPDIIAVTTGDPIIDKKKGQAKAVGGRVVEVMQRKKEHSTSNLVEKMN